MTISAICSELKPESSKYAAPLKEARGVTSTRGYLSLQNSLTPTTHLSQFLALGLMASVMACSRLVSYPHSTNVKRSAKAASNGLLSGNIGFAPLPQVLPVAISTKSLCLATRL